MRGKVGLFSSVANSHSFIQAFDSVFPWKSQLREAGRGEPQLSSQKKVTQESGALENLVI